MHQELSKDAEDHKLGDVKTTPLNQHTIGLHTSNCCFSFIALYRINLERFCSFCYFGLVFCLRPPLFICVMRELLEVWVELSWML